MRLEVDKEKKKVAESQEEMRAWILRRREVDKLQMDFWAEYAQDMENAKVALAEMVVHIRDNFKPDVVDLLKFDDWVEDILQWHANKVEKQKKQNAMKEADAASQGVAARQGVAASQDRVWSARPRYHRFFNEAAGRPADSGPPGATCEQPQKPAQDMDNEQWVKWWLDLGGYSSCNQVDENGWTPLHHCVEAMVHWDQAWKICNALIQKMAASQEGVKCLRAQTLKGQPPHRTALHMLSCNSDRALKKAEMALFRAQAANEVDPLDDQGRTPLMHAVGTGLVDVAKALVQAGADPNLQSHDGRNIANRAHGSSGMMSEWIRYELKIKPADVEVHSRYRKSGAVSLSRHHRYHAQGAMLRAEEAQVAASQGPAPVASSSGAAASSSGWEPAASQRPTKARAAGGGPPFKARPWPTSPSSPPRERWRWFWDESRQKWSWYWTE